MLYWLYEYGLFEYLLCQFYCGMVVAVVMLTLCMYVCVCVCFVLFCFALFFSMSVMNSRTEVQ